jgi:hypothetical protein
MTVKEKALERLISGEAVKVRSEITKKYVDELEALNCRIKFNPNSEFIKGYAKTSEKLLTISNADSRCFLNMEYEEL